MHLKCSRTDVFPWFSNEYIKIKGYFFDANGDYFEQENLLNVIPKGLDKTQLISLIEALNGCFSIVYETVDFTFSAVDRLRNFPVFYTIEDGTLELTDEFLSLNNGNDLNERAKEEFLRVGFTVGKETLFKNVNQLIAGQYLFFDKKSQNILVDSYYKNWHLGDNDSDSNELLKQLDIIVTQWAQRLIISAAGKTIFAGLSGGYDSRLIVCALKREDYENVVCFSYGHEDSYEHSIAKKVADKLGYPIHIVKYSEDLWERAINSEEFDKYCQLGLSKNSNPCIQELPAIFELHNRGLIPEDSIIVPGYAADLLGGSYVPKNLESKEVNKMLEMGVSDFIYNNIYGYYSGALNDPMKNKLKENIFNNLAESDCLNINDFDRNLEHWFTDNHVSKFINSTVRTYEIFGYGWRLPLWDNDFADWWYGVPIGLRSNNVLYHEYLFTYLFEPFYVAYKKPPPPKIGFIKRMLSKEIKLFILNVASKIKINLATKVKDEGNLPIASIQVAKRISAEWNLDDFKSVNGLVGAYCLDKLVNNKINKK